MQTLPEYSGIFITLEGGDGTGKSTQVKLLHEALTHQGHDVIVTREPGGTEQAEKIRNLLLQRDGGHWDPMSEAMLLFAARREHLVNRIWPALKEGKWVISDRFVDSSRAFQGYGMGLDLGFINKLYKMIAGDFNPDLTFIFDLPPEIGLERSSQQLQMTDIAIESTEDRYELMGLEFQKCLRKGFLEIAKQEPERCAIIDATQNIENVHQQLMREIDKRFGQSSIEVAHNG